jgi:TonB-linked SusC/RagA family outer membrane protein
MELNGSSLKEVLREIRKQTEFTVLYRSSDVRDVAELDADFEDATVMEILDQCLKGTSLGYEVKDKVIVIYPVDYVPEPVIKKTVQEKKTITGTVTDTDGVPLPGVSVIIKGTSTGVATDIDGNYSLDIEQERAVLVFSFVGMLSQERNYTGQLLIDVELSPDTEGLDEVVVTGYQTIAKERAAGSFAKISADALEERSTLNLIQKLEGQASGVLYENGKITIRGVSSFNASTQPLIVVDGFPLEGINAGANPSEILERINPDNIESITVLKDAAAASIWGARAANGVIVIVSKKGIQKGKPRVEFSSSLSFTNHNLSSFTRASSESFLELEKHIADNQWVQLPIAGTPNQPAYNTGLDTYLRLNAGLIPQKEADQIINDLKGVDVRDEFEDLFLRKQVRQHYGLSVSGATDKSNYYMSLGYDDNNSFAKNTDENRIVADVKLNTELSDKISISTGISATIRNEKNNGFGPESVNSLPVYQRILDKDGNYIAQANGYAQEAKDFYVDSGWPYNWDYNIYQEFENRDNTTQRVDLRMHAGLNIKLLKGLNFEGRYQYQWSNSKNQILENENTYSVRNQVNLRTYIDDDGVMQHAIPKGYIRSDDHAYMKTFTTRGQLSFERSFNNEMHQINAIVGVEVRKTVNEGSSQNKYGYDPQTLQYVNVDFVNNYPLLFSRSSSGSRIADPSRFSYSENRFASYYGNAGYTYNEKYTITGSARLDDSNLFGTSKKYRNVPLWSVGANWQLHKEDFININFINRLTFRATYGTGGNINKDTSPFLTAVVWNDPRDQHQYAYIALPKNPNLRWEKTATTNIGVDYALWNNRISGSVEYYNRKGVDLLGNVSLNAIYGFSGALINFAEMSNKGVDFSVNIGILNKKLKWNAIANFSANKNRVEKVELSDESVAGAVGLYGLNPAREGKPLGHLYSYRWAGLSDKGLPQIYNEKGEVIDHTTEMTEIEGLNYEGATSPKYYGSFQNILSYKRLRLSMLIAYKLGYKFRTPSVNYSDLTSATNLNAVHKDIEQRWKKTGDELTTDIPVLPVLSSEINRNFNSYNKFGSHRVESASHIRFRDVVLSYDLPKSWFKSLGLASINIGAQVRNLGVITFNDAKLDPENIIDSSKGKVKPEYTLSLKARF